MKTNLRVVTILVTLLAATGASAQQPLDESAQIRKGERKIRIGVSLMAAGALVIPATYLMSDHPNRGSAAAGLGLMMGGGCVIALGIRDQQKAVRPAVTALLTVNRSRTAVQFRRAW